MRLCFPISKYEFRFLSQITTMPYKPAIEYTHEKLFFVFTSRLKIYIVRPYFKLQICLVRGYIVLLF